MAIIEIPSQEMSTVDFFIYYNLLQKEEYYKF